MSILMRNICQTRHSGRFIRRRPIVNEIFKHQFQMDHNRTTVSCSLSSATNSSPEDPTNAQELKSHLSSTLCRYTGGIANKTQLKLHMTAVRCIEEKRLLDVTWSCGDVTSYPYVWLRDNCQCSMCYNSASKSRSSLLHDLPLDAHPTECSVCLSNSSIIAFSIPYSEKEIILYIH